MSIWTDQAVKDLQMKVAWLEKELKALREEMRITDSAVGKLMKESNGTSNQSNAGPTKPLGLPNGKGKPS